MPKAPMSPELSAAETNLRQSISLAVNLLAEVEIMQERQGWFGRFAKIYTYRSVRRLRQHIKKCNRLLAAAVFAALMVAIAVPAQAQMACDTRDIIIEMLEGRYGEVRRGIGMAGPTAIFEIWASDQPPHTWTILKTAPNGITCLLAVGENWHDDAAELTPTASPI